jgi:hypothetical protein
MHALNVHCWHFIVVHVHRFISSRWRTACALRTNLVSWEIPPDCLHLTFAIYAAVVCWSVVDKRLVDAITSNVITLRRIVLAFVKVTFQTIHIYI